MKESKEIEIDTRRLLGRIGHKLWIIALGAVLGAAVCLLGTACLITPRYQSSALFYVNNSAVSGSSISSGDIAAAKSLVDSYILILETRESLQDVIDCAGVERTCQELKTMIRAAGVNSTEFFEVIVTSADPEEAERIASAIAIVLPERISGVIGGASVRIAEAAVVEASPSFPSYWLNTLIGLLLGAVLPTGVIIVKAMFDPVLRCEGDIDCGLPVLAAVPNMTIPTGTKDGIGFSGEEAYRLLCAKLRYTLEGENPCPVIGISSALSGEGKTVTAIHLAESLAQLDKQVVLIDCERPSAALSAAKAPGLSDFLAGESPLGTLVQACGIANVSVIASGSVRSNPARLLHSGKMDALMDQLREAYDYVILDLPPILEVSDALTVAKQMDGVLLVVRQDYSSREAIADSIRQLKAMEANILGIVYNGTREADSSFGRKYDHPFYQKYPHKYGGGDPMPVKKT